VLKITLPPTKLKSFLLFGAVCAVLSSCALETASVHTLKVQKAIGNAIEKPLNEITADISVTEPETGVISNLYIFGETEGRIYAYSTDGTIFIFSQDGKCIKKVNMTHYALVQYYYDAYPRYDVFDINT